MDSSAGRSRHAGASDPDDYTQGLSERLFGKVAPGETKYAAASEEDRDELLRLSNAALARIPYLDLRAGEHEESPRSMIRVVATARGNFPTESIQADVRTVWRTGVVKGRISLHVVKATEDGFEFHFAILQEDTFLTGIYAVIIARALTP